MPTGFGWAFAVMSFIMLALAIGYLNNLLYFFVFLLISMALTGMWLTNKNVDSVVVRQIEALDLFANESGLFLLHLENKRPSIFLYDIQISWQKNKEASDAVTVKEVHRGQNQYLSFRPTQRGWQSAPRLVIQSVFPFHMLRAWKYYESSEKILVFPEKKGQSEFPDAEGGLFSDSNQRLQTETEGLFRDHRDFQKTDSPNRIDWRRSLKHQKHLVRNYESPTEQNIQLSWQQTAHLGSFEERVSQLALWVDLAFRRNYLFSLKLQNQETGFDRSSEHYRACLRQLALLQPEEIV